MIIPFAVIVLFILSLILIIQKMSLRISVYKSKEFHTVFVYGLAVLFLILELICLSSSLLLMLVFHTFFPGIILYSIVLIFLIVSRKILKRIDYRYERGTYPAQTA
ncbi:MAG: hypothetical protein JW881_05585 [Spirochaetales bacterium]|nr:hypothetical protein [Spirochaetales bacterium]